MKNSFTILSLLFTAVFCSNETVLAAETSQLSQPVVTKPSNQPGFPEPSHPLFGRRAEPSEAVTAKPIQPSFEMNLTEDQAENSENPISVPLGSTICVHLCGDKTLSQVYSSGSGSCWGHYWSWDNEKNEVLSLRQCPAYPSLNRLFKNGNTLHHDEKINELGTTLTIGKWIFDTKTAGLTTLTFKQYYYSNATIRNIDGSSPRKDPINEIHFTINVVDAASE